MIMFSLINLGGVYMEENPPGKVSFSSREDLWTNPAVLENTFILKFTLYERKLSPGK